MKKCYEDESLQISKSAFTKPSKISIATDCAKWKAENSGGEIPDEFDL
jgi:penicillin-binding protein 1A